MSTAVNILKLRLSYTPFADLAAGRVGEPGQGYPISPHPAIVIYVRRDDPSELLAFHIEHFSESFAEEMREAFAPLLGTSVMEELMKLWAQVPHEPRALRGLSDDEFEKAVQDGKIELTSEISEADAATRAARIHALDEANAWE